MSQVLFPSSEELRFTEAHLALSDYRETIEQQLKSLPREMTPEQVAAELAKPRGVDDLAARRGSSMAPEVYESIVRERLQADLDQRRPQLEVVFPQLWRRFFIVAVMSSLEEHADGFCKALRESRELRLGWRDLRGGVLDRLHGYAFKIAHLSVPPTLWEGGRWLEQVRDCIVHVNGEVGRSRDAGALRAMVGKFPGYAIGDRGQITLEEEAGKFALVVFTGLFRLLFLQAELPASPTFAEK